MGFDCRGRSTNAACLRRSLPGNPYRHLQRMTKLRPASSGRTRRGRSGGNPLCGRCRPDCGRACRRLFGWRSPPNGSAARHSCSRRCCSRPALSPISPRTWSHRSARSLASVAAAAALTFVSRSRLALHLAFAALLCVALGTLFAKIETMQAGTKVLGGEISTRLTGRVAVIEHQDDGRIRMTIDVLGTERPKLRYAPQRVRVSARSIPEGLLAGDVVSGVARLAPPSGPTRPDGYDFSFNSYFDGIGANGFFLTGARAELRRLSRAARHPLPYAGREPAHRACQPDPRGDRRRGGRDRRRPRRRRQGRHSGRRRRISEANRAGARAFDLRPAHGAGCGDDHVRAAGRLRLLSRFRIPPARQEICRERRACGALRLSLHFRHGGRRRAQLHHDRRHAHCGLVRPRGADDAQPCNIRQLPSSQCRRTRSPDPASRCRSPRLRH